MAKRGRTGRIDPHPQYMNATRVWTIAEFAVDAVVAGITRSVAITLPTGAVIGRGTKYGIEIAEGTVYWENAMPTAGVGAFQEVRASLGYRNLEATTTLPPNDPAHILYWKWKVQGNGTGVFVQDHTTAKPESSDGAGIVAVSQRLFLNIRFSESAGAGWAAATANVRFFMRVLFRFVKVTEDEINSLLANATALQ